jgi:hypothetical protein
MVIQKLKTKESEKKGKQNSYQKPKISQRKSTHRRRAEALDKSNRNHVNKK